MMGRPLRLVASHGRTKSARSRRLLDWLGDFGDQRLVIYPVRSLICSGVLLFLFRLEARRRRRFDLGSAAGVANLNRIAETSIEEVPHPDTLVYYLKGLCPEELSGVRTGMVRGLVRSRALQGDRLLGCYYTIAIDGTGLGAPVAKLYGSSRAFARRPCSER
ncbi:MAG: hypothetical protein ABIF82_07085 [Planctomycetota bacterium]